MMKQSVVIGAQKSQLVDRAIPDIQSDEVLVKVRVCAVCASELHTWEHPSEGALPLALGHEVSGDVVRVGSAVRTIRPGMAVTGLFQQGFAEYAVAPAHLVVPIPEAVSYEAALGEPLSCVMSAARRTRLELGDRIAIVGMGFMGLLMLQALRLKGPAHVTVIDVRQEALDLARAFGAEQTLLPDQVPPEMKLVNWSQLGGDDGLDVVVEASGTQPGLSLAGSMVRAHGVLSILGYHQGGPRQVDMELWNWKALEVLNAHERRTDYQMDSMRRGLALVAAGKIDVGSLVSHRFALDQVDDAFAALLTKPAGYKKAVVVPGLTQ